MIYSIDKGNLTFNPDKSVHFKNIYLKYGVNIIKYSMLFKNHYLKKTGKFTEDSST